MTAVLEIRLFGGLEIRLADKPVSAFVSSKAPALLAYLAITRRPSQRDTLATLLWGEMGDADAKNNLRQALTSLRKVLDPYLDITRDTVALREDMPCWVDVRGFLAALRRTSGSALEMPRLQAAVDLYHGDCLEGFFVRDAPEFEEWALAQRTRFREMALQAMHSLAEQQMATSDYAAAIDTTTRLLALDAWREESHRLLMLALARTGQFSAALSQYQACRRVMLDTFGAEPSTETSALYERVRAAQHGLRHNLPAALTGFVGRADEMRDVRSRLTVPTCRLLTIVGPGGGGKTRLALEAAAASTANFLNGVWFVSLAAVSPDEPEALASTLAAAVQLAPGAGDLRRQLIDFLRQRELLLVLDNLEHLLDGVGWLSELLAAAPDVKILATSRERLNLQVEQVVHLHGLPMPPPDATTLERYGAVELFARRARRIDPAFALNAENGPAVAQICRLIGGLPLGIELAAAWANQLSCAEIATAIAASLDFLSTDRRDVSPRQRSLRAVFEYSWHLLDKTEQAAFARLAVFRGTFTRAAAAEVAAVRLPVLAALADKSLVRRVDGERYDLHEVLRQFAGEQLAELESPAAIVRARHSRYYAQLVAGQTERCKGREQREALAQIGAEIDDVRVAWHEAAAHFWLEPLHLALEGIYHFYMLRSWLAEGLEMFHSARVALEAAADRSTPQHQLAIGRLLTREAKFLLTFSRFDEARALLLRGSEYLHDLDAPADVANARYYLGQVCASTGAYAEAEAHVQESLAVRRTLDDRWGQAVSLLELAGLCFYRGDFPAAKTYCEDGLRLAEAVGDLQTTAHLLTGLSIVARQLGDFTGARDYVARGLAVYDELDSPYGRVQGRLTLGGLAVAQGDYAAAKPDFERALTLSREIGFRSGEADSHFRLGQVATALGESALAASHLRLALQIAAAAQEAPLLLDTLHATVLFLASQPSPELALLVAWLLRQPNLDARRRSELSALPAAGTETQLAKLTLQDVAGLAHGQLDRQLSQFGEMGLQIP